MLGAVLVGGESRRMGRDKALIRIDEQTMVDRTARLLAAAGCDPVVAIGPPHLAGSVTAVADRHPGEGPLGAIITALHHAAAVGATTAFVVACDLPGLDRATLATMLTGRDAAPSPAPSVTIAVTDRREPLVAIWDVACLAVLEARFAGGERAVHRLIDAIAAIDGMAAVDVMVDAARVHNVNTPDQLPTE